MNTKHESQHVVPHEDGWAVIKANASKASFTSSSKAQAEAYAREVAANQDVPLFIHDSHGKIMGSVNPKNNSQEAGISKTIHIVPDGNSWAVKNERTDLPVQTFQNKYDAVKVAHRIADERSATMVVHDKQGRVHHVDTPPHYPSALADVMHLR